MKAGKVKPNLETIRTTIGDDATTSVAKLRELVEAFVAEREWHRFHAPKNLGMALAIEAAELMEHFQWLGVEESRAIESDPETYQAVREELADVLCYALAMANSLKIDISSAVAAKMTKNARKYPASEQGSAIERSREA